MREQDIRPAELQDQLQHLLEQDRKLWLASRPDFVKVPCPACRGQRVQQSVEFRSYTFDICADCETVFYNPRPTAQQLTDYYTRAQSYHFWAEKIFPATEKTRRENIFLPLADRVEKQLEKAGGHRGIFLEVGAGFGIFAEEIQGRKLFSRVIAVEPTPGLAQKCRDKQLETLEMPIEEVELDPGSISCLASFEVIEHLFEPRAFLEECWSLLNDDGLLIMTCPNVQGFDFTVLGLENAPNMGLEHINMFHPRSLRNLLEGVGFEVVDLLTPGRLDADIVRNQALKGNFDLTAHPFLKNILLDRWDELGPAFQQFLADNLLSSSMMVTARKDTRGRP